MQQYFALSFNYLNLQLQLQCIIMHFNHYHLHKLFQQSLRFGEFITLNLPESNKSNFLLGNAINIKIFFVKTV